MKNSKTVKSVKTAILAIMLMVVSLVSNSQSSTILVPNTVCPGQTVWVKFKEGTVQLTNKTLYAKFFSNTTATPPMLSQTPNVLFPIFHGTTYDSMQVVIPNGLPLNSSIKVYSSNGVALTSYATFTVIQSAPKPTLSSTSTNPLLCNGLVDTLRINTTSTYTNTIHWYKYASQQTSTAVTYTVNTAGQYYASIANTCGVKSYSDTITVSVNSTPSVSANTSTGNKISCNGISLTLTKNLLNPATATLITYTWYKDSTNTTPLSSASATSTGSYIVKASNTCGSSQDTVKVFVQNITPTITLNGDTATTNSINAIGSDSIVKNLYRNDTLIATNIDTLFNLVCGAVYKVENVVYFAGQNCSRMDTAKYVCNYAGIRTTATIIEGIKFYPNPANDVLNISFESKQSKNTSIEVFDLLGNLISKTNKQVNFGENVVKLDLTNLETGLYVVRIENKSEKVQVVK